MSRHTRERSNFPIARVPDMRIGMRLTMKAENANVPASSSSASVSGLARPIHPLTTTRIAKIAPPSGSVRVRAHQADRVRVRELPARHQVRQARVARRAPQQREALDENDSRKMSGSERMNAMDPYITPRAMSAVIMIRLRSKRSTSTPAIGPNRSAGSMRAAMTPADGEPLGGPADQGRHEGRAPPRTPPSPRATRPSCAASSRENAGWVRRSLSVADRVPRSAATSSANDDTGRA